MAEDDLHQLAGAFLVLGRRRDPDVGAAGEDRGGLAVVAGQRVDAELVAVPLTDFLAVLLHEVADRPVRPARGHDRRGREAGLPGDLLVRVGDHVGVVDVEPGGLVLGRLGGAGRSLLDLLQLREALDRVRVGERRGPLAAVGLGEVATVGEDPGDAVAPVLAADEEAGEVLDLVRVLLREGLHRRVELVEGLGHLDASSLVDVLAVEHVAGAEVVRQRVVLAVHLADLDEGLQQLVAAEFCVQVGDVGEGADVGERR